MKSIFFTVFAALCAAAPPTGDLNMMIILAVLLIAGFLIFILVKSGKKKR